METLAVCHARLARWLRFGTLSLSLAGSQLIWSMELAYGTPYLLSIGLSKEATGLVWIAGPVSGLIMQPVLGSLSDSSSSMYRRRKYMAMCAVVAAFSACMIAFAKPLAGLLADLLRIGLGDWDPVRKHRVVKYMQVLSIVGFWILDFAVNGLQVISRALILDNAGLREQNEANAWQARMLHLGNMVGYGCGWANLAAWPILDAVGGTQFRKFAVVSVLGMAVCVAITFLTTPEFAQQGATSLRGDGAWRRIWCSVHEVVCTARTLPQSIRSVCWTQLFATMSWFPFLFYSTTYIVDMSHKHKGTAREEELGSLGMLLFASVAMLSSLILPSFSLAGHDASIALGLPRRSWPRLRLRALWCLGALLQAALLLLGTFFVHTQRHAILLVAAMGVPWGIWTWVPFALIGEFVREAEASSGVSGAEQWYAQRIMDHHDTPARQSVCSDRDTITPYGTPQRYLSGTSMPSIVSRGRAVGPDDDATPADSARGGTILGIHNIAVCAPQFLVALIASLIFRLTSEPKGHKRHKGNGDVAWVLRFGGCMAVLAACFAQRIPFTQSERSADNTQHDAPLDDEDDEETDGSVDIA
ncbi:hypothetical protein MVES1_003449 [Malassezia vespertilionis]|uniref:General alpha-glucoside permease n=1 Tax=Malassezia vespertilionis TaxID=2020962 RepID=A0A2N1J7R7_9BASI|nr:uncharacterized protein MVES1_003449 [Malassezia vespertilionis]PKI82502.1 hypothetical protein MVES_003687 [Malassezia vespertilionis]WFD08080.1 hypothetical protein MVES1_003449 [Malassezia vespertilionis]